MHTRFKVRSGIGPSAGWRNEVLYTNCTSYEFYRNHVTHLFFVSLSTIKMTKSLHFLRTGQSPSLSCGSIKENRASIRLLVTSIQPWWDSISTYANPTSPSEARPAISSLTHMFSLSQLYVDAFWKHILSLSWVTESELAPNSFVVPKCPFHLPFRRVDAQSKFLGEGNKTE